jgi:anti-sigma regulatory factor (Ser/Thr protein kinase)
MSPESLIAAVVVPADPSYLTICRNALVGAAGGMPIDDEELDDLKLLLSETCSNAIVHGYGEGPPGEIEVEFRVASGDFEVTVSDRGRGFSGGAVPEHTGFGLSLVAQIADRYRIDPARPGGGATVTFARVLNH